MPGLPKSIGAGRADRTDGPRAARIRSSPQWAGERFRDVLPREEPRGWSALRDWVLAPSANRVPGEPLAVERRAAGDFASGPGSGLRVTWLGHSTTLVELDGARVLFDPVLGPRASPFECVGPKRFHPPPLAMDELGRLVAGSGIDLVAISHDHYDHLDYPTILALAKTCVPFVVPLGVGAHLELWGVAPERIVELDWWEAHPLERTGGPPGVELVAIPARHFSGRSPTMADRDRSLWAGYVLRGPEHRVCFTGDTALFPGMEQIGRRLGPFDVGLIEAGAYNPLWRDVHIGPEQAVVAAQLLGVERMLPVHWGTFDLSTHPWTEPIERILTAAGRVGLALDVPRPGGRVVPAERARWPRPERWWPELRYQRATERPLVSSGLGAALEARVRALGAAFGGERASQAPA